MSDITQERGDMEYKTIMYEKEDGIAILTFNRPHRLNAVNIPMMLEISDVLKEASADKALRVLILTGTGRGFCAGGDFKGDEDSLIGFEQPRFVNPVTAYEDIVGYTRSITLGLQSLRIPTIAMVNGAAVGQGFSMAQACDLRTGSENARFMVGWTRRGVGPAFGDTWMLPRLIGLGRAIELIFSGRFLEAEEAYRIGLLNKLVPAASLREETMALADQLAKGPPIALKLDKLNIYRGLHQDLRTALEALASDQAQLVSTKDFLEATRAFQEKREAVFRGM